jgi:hypothetical protein
MNAFDSILGRILRSRFFLTAILLIAGTGGVVRSQTQATGEIRLLVRGDDMGVAQAANEACIRCYRDGIMRSTEVIVPGAWFLDAVRLLRENPQLDVGVHLCLTSEWERCKWRPLTHAPSLVDANGCFYPMNSQRKDFPPNTGFLDAQPKLDEVERELRAQIELARKLIPQVSHLSAHMGTPMCTPELRQLSEKLAREYRLPLEATNVQYVRGFSGPQKTPAQKAADLVRIASELTPGSWLLIEHPGLDTPEMKALGHLGYYNVSQDRVGVTTAFTSDQVKRVIQQRRIRLISYADLNR